MDNYSEYRLKDWDWIALYKQKMGEQPFREYVNDVYSELMNMRVGESFSLDDNVRVENRELFVKIVCMFIQEGNADFDFTPDFKTVRRHEKASMVRKSGKATPGETGEVDTEGNCRQSGENGASR